MANPGGIRPVASAAPEPAPVDPVGAWCCAWPARIEAHPLYEAAMRPIRKVAA